MPTIETFIVEGYTDQQKQQLISSLTSAVVTAIDAPIDSVRIIITEVAEKNFGIAGKTAAALRQEAQLGHSASTDMQDLASASSSASATLAL
jgi:4-oxalocrotonate tautomerase